MENCNYILHNIYGSDSITIITHGSNNDIHSEFITNIHQKCVDNGVSTLRLQMPFKDKGLSMPNTSDANEEIEAISTTYQHALTLGYKRIHFIGKSMGAILFSHFFDTLSKRQLQDIDFTILGYVHQHTKLNASLGNIHIIQGQNDIHGSQEDIESNIKKLHLNNISLDVIPNANHSYKDHQGKAVYQKDAINLIKV